MNCPCCGGRIETAGGCVACMFQTIYCGLCGARFCGEHGREAFDRHPESCPNVQHIGTTVPVSRIWTGEAD